MHLNARKLGLAAAIAFGLLAALAAPSLAQETAHQPAAEQVSGAAPHATGEHAAGEHGEKGTVFAGGLGNAIVTLIIFGIVVYVLGTKAWPPLLAALNEREKSIRSSLENARREREESSKLFAQYQAQLDRARQEATAIVEEGRRDAEVVHRKIQDDARREAEETLARARREIQLATETAIRELYDRTADLAVQVAGGIIRKELKADDHRALVQESLERMGQSSRN